MVELNLKIPYKRIPNPSLHGAFKSTPNFFIGKWAIVTKKGVINKFLPEIADKYPGKNMTLRIFDTYIKDKLHEITQIQNLAWFEGCAPKVYETLKVKIGEEVHLAQVTEFVEGEFLARNRITNRWEEISKSLKKYGVNNKQDAFRANFIDNKLVDFGGFHFTDDDNADKITQHYRKTTYWSNDSNPYQSIPELGMIGSRTQERYKLLEMDDFTGKTVLDIGCSGGQSLFWAADRGATRVVGLDTPEIAEATFRFANLKRYYGLETIGCDLTKDDIVKKVRNQTGIEKFDIVVMFSVNHHIGFHQYMKDLCGDTLYLETNAAKLPDVEHKEYPEELTKLGYSKFIHKGQVNESGDRSLFICE